MATRKSLRCEDNTRRSDGNCSSLSDALKYYQGLKANDFPDLIKTITEDWLVLQGEKVFFYGLEVSTLGVHLEYQGFRSIMATRKSLRCENNTRRSDDNCRSLSDVLKYYQGLKANDFPDLIKTIKEDWLVLQGENIFFYGLEVSTLGVHLEYQGFNPMALAILLDRMTRHSYKRAYDIPLMIAISIERGNTISKMAEASTSVLSKAIEELIATYKIVDKPKKNPRAITLSRVAASFPHVACAYMSFARNLTVTDIEMHSMVRKYPRCMMCPHFAALIPKNGEGNVETTLKKAHAVFNFAFSMKINSKKKPKSKRSVVNDIWKYMCITHNGSYLSEDQKLYYLKAMKIMVKDNDTYDVVTPVKEAVKYWDKHYEKFMDVNKIKGTKESSDSEENVAVEEDESEDDREEKYEELKKQIKEMEDKKGKPKRNDTMADSIKALWREVDAVCFDVDSTVIKEEAIDEVAKFCNKGLEVQQLTNNAMSGKMDFREALSARLQIIKPSLQQIRDFIKNHPFHFTPGVKELIGLLQQKNVPVYLISGGFRGLIGPIAIELSIPLQHIYANKLKFFLNGEYAGFDEKEYTSKNGGKAEVISMLKEKFGYTKLFMIGDGITDLEACPPADAFIGFGGNVVREEVKSRSKWYVESFQELIDAL